MGLKRLETKRKNKQKKKKQPTPSYGKWRAMV